MSPKLNPVYVELAETARKFVRAYDRARAHAEEHGRVSPGLDEGANKAAGDLITVVLAGCVKRHPRAIETAYKIVQKAKRRG